MCEKVCAMHTTSNIILKHKNLKIDRRKTLNNTITHAKDINAQNTEKIPNSQEQYENILNLTIIRTIATAVKCYESGKIQKT
jgi:hypothetical protein